MALWVLISEEIAGVNIVQTYFYLTLPPSALSIRRWSLFNMARHRLPHTRPRVDALLLRRQWVWNRDIGRKERRSGQSLQRLNEDFHKRRPRLNSISVVSTFPNVGVTATGSHVQRPPFARICQPSRDNAKDFRSVCLTPLLRARSMIHIWLLLICQRHYNSSGVNNVNSTSTSRRTRTSGNPQPRCTFGRDNHGKERCISS